MESSLETAENVVGTQIINAAMTVHSALGPGLLESTYERCLAYELFKRDLRASAQVSIPFRYGDLLIEDAYQIDLLVDNIVVIEVKAVETVLPVHQGQPVSYLRLGSYRLGYILNFNVAHMRDGIIRRVNRLQFTASSGYPLRPLR